MHMAEDTFPTTVYCLLLLDRIGAKFGTRIGIQNWSRTWIRIRAGIRVTFAGVRFPQLTG